MSVTNLDNTVLLFGIHPALVFDWMWADMVSAGGDGTPCLFVENWETALNACEKYIRQQHPAETEDWKVEKYPAHSCGHIGAFQEGLVFSAEHPVSNDSDTNFIAIKTVIPFHSHHPTIVPCKWVPDFLKEIHE